MQLTLFTRSLTEKKEIPQILTAGEQNITVNYKIQMVTRNVSRVLKEMLLSAQGEGGTATFTRFAKISDGVGVERLFPCFLPILIVLSCIK